MYDENIKFLAVVDGLKTETRWDGMRAWAQFKNSEQMESVADHSWHLCLLIMTVVRGDTFAHIDVLKCLKIAVIHDLAEVITGDINAYLVTKGVVTPEDKMKMEEQAINNMIKNVDERVRSEIVDLFHEYGSGVSREAVLVKALDKIDGWLHFIEHASPDFADSFGMEGVRHMGYWGNKQVQRCPELKDFSEEVKSRMRTKYERSGVKWEDDVFNLKWD